ncbi:hypothetical protein LWI29_017086 [Acer saccharum]|uniref:Uncharacterized protein n=1 Tax=Acer saccharum TaxID=4024 RepID=A0AA39RR77_ACESA|nr:hypothetical protein LWI29_017086 [Acer saccharum]
MRATIPSKPVGNRDWHPRSNSGNVRRLTSGMEGGRGRTHWFHNSDAGFDGQGLAGRPVSKPKGNTDNLGSLNAEMSEGIIEGQSNSISVLDGNCKRDLGDGNSIGRDILGRGKGKSVITVDLRLNELAIDGLAVSASGLGPNGAFIFGSSVVKESYLCLYQLDTRHFTLAGLENRRVSDDTRVEECIGPPSVASVVCKKVSGNGRGVGQWKKAAREKSRGLGNSKQSSACGKRKEGGTVEYFMDGTKKPKVDSSSSVSMVLSAGQQSLAHRSQ